MKKPLEFPRTYTTSSAAYRVTYQLKEKGDTREFMVTKEGDKVFKVSVKETVSLEDFLERFKKIEKGEVTYKYFPDGVHGPGFYELKTGDRRRPNSVFLPVNEVYEEYTK
jgi:hypothetical protein